MPSVLRRILEENVLEAAPAFLGSILVRGDLRARIVETEAYRTPDDPGCHAHRGQTPRNRAMYGEPGMAYIYFTYGNHWMLNVAAHTPGVAAAVLIRAAEPISGFEVFRTRRPKAKRDEDLLSGPGKLAAAFDIDSRLYGIDLLDPSSELHLEPGEPVNNVAVGTRMGSHPDSETHSHGDSAIEIACAGSVDHFRANRATSAQPLRTPVCIIQRMIATSILFAP